MTNKEILAASLLEWSLASKNQWLEIEDADMKELASLAVKKGLVLPSPDLAILKTYYAEIGVPNGNGVLLQKADVDKSLPTLIGKQVNFDHMGANHVCGYILDAKLEGKMIVAYACIFKSLFKEQFDVVKEKFSKGELTVSFEIWNVNPETKESVVKHLDNGNRIISPILFHGCGLLLVKPPACPKARVTALLAELIDEKIVAEASKIVEPILQPNDELVYAELALPCLNCPKCQLEHKEREMAQEKPVDEAKIVGDPIDPNLFVKADGTLDEEKIEAALPKEVTARVKELIKEGKSPADAVKQAWKEHQEKADQSDEDQKKAKEKADQEAAEKAAAEKVAQEAAEKAATEAAEKAKFDEAKAYVEAHWQREGNQNWNCPDCAFTFPLLSSETPTPQYCPRCGSMYMSEADERPCEAEMSDGCDLMNEEMLHADESMDLEESKKLPYSKRQELPDSEFAVVVKKGDQKVRMFPIHDEAHVRNALARLGQPKPRATLKSLGVSVESVKRKILNRAKKLGMTDLVERHKESSALETEAILNLSAKVDELNTAIDTQKKELDTVKAELEQAKKDSEAVTAQKADELGKKDQEIATLKEELGRPHLTVGSIIVATNEELKQQQAKVDEIAFGKKSK